MSTNGTATSRGGPVISHWSAVSAYGIGRMALAEGLRTGRAADVPLRADLVAAPDERACLVPDFDPAAMLGRGTRQMHRATAFAIVAVSDVLDGIDRRRLDGAGGLGIVMGIGNGAVQGMMDFTRTSFTAARPFFVEAVEMPKLVMNGTAGQCAIWHRLRGPNTTVAGGDTAGMVGLGYTRRVLANSRAGAMLCGGVEEYTPARAWLARSAGHAPSSPLGEGCAMLLVEPPGATDPSSRALTEISAVRVRSFRAGGFTAALRSCLDFDAALPTRVWLAAASGTAGALAEAELRELTDRFGTEAVHRAGDPGLIGDTSAASVTFRIAEVLCLAENEPAEYDRHAVITSVDPVEGVAGCVVLRIIGRGDGRFNDPPPGAARN